MDKWNDDWRDELKNDDYEIWERLAECRNTRKDMIHMAKLVYKYNPSKSKEECLDRILEWVTDWNSQVGLYPETTEEYNDMLNRI
ncbi:MAG: hypothetical protein VZS44_11935 [Bacilli bacterium]|nr:hypothetical protein [Bacilli bacterium]